MFNILLVEDVPLILHSLSMLLANHFPDANIEAVGCEAAAREVLDMYERHGLALDIAVLDLMLPIQSGACPEASTLCAEMWPRQPAAFVIHITAYSSNPEVEAHFKHCHPETRPGRPVEKTSERWEDTVLAVIASKRVERQLVDLGMLAPGVGPFCSYSGFGCGTPAAAHLVNDIRRYWRLLDAGLQQKIQAAFTVDPSQDPIRVGLGGGDEAAQE